ncbi:hypothetical protein PFISCL1PPCAC_3406, partial [Pristionchus fissidentatus]
PMAQYGRPPSFNPIPPMPIHIPMSYPNPYMQFASYYDSHEQFYNVFRRDRNSRGGGVAIIVHSSISAIQISDETVKGSHELIAIDLDINGDLLRIICAYRNPKATTLQTDSLIKSITDLCSCPQPSVITGDFNLPDIDWPSFPTPQKNNITPSSQSFIDLCKSIKLAQLVKDPTRKENILDLVLCNNPGIVTKTEVGPPFDISDHNTVKFELSLVHSVPAFTLKRDFKKADYDMINCQLANVDWVTAFSTMRNIDKMYDLLIKVIQKSIDTHVPWVKVNVTHGKIPPHIERLLVKRFNAWQKSIALSCPRLTREFESLNRRFRTELIRYQKTIERKIIESEDRNKFFRYMKRCVNKQRGVEGLKNSTGNLILDDQGKANLLAETFASVFTTDDGNLPTTARTTIQGYQEPLFLRHEICALISKWKRNGINFANAGSHANYRHNSFFPRAARLFSKPGNQISFPV